MSIFACIASFKCTLTVKKENLISETIRLKGEQNEYATYILAIPNLAFPYVGLDLSGGVAAMAKNFTRRCTLSDPTGEVRHIEAGPIGQYERQCEWCHEKFTAYGSSRQSACNACYDCEEYRLWAEFRSIEGFDREFAQFVARLKANDPERVYWYSMLREELRMSM